MKYLLFILFATSLVAGPTAEGSRQGANDAVKHGKPKGFLCI